MSNFVFMLTRNDQTVSDAEEVYEGVRGCGLRYVGFKDVGLPRDGLAAVTAAAHADGLEVMLEVVSVTLEGELQSLRSAREIGVDWVLGGTHVEAGVVELTGASAKYCPFVGQVRGHPSVLSGTPSSIAEHAFDVTSQRGVYGVDLLAYRHTKEDPIEVTKAVLKKSRGPVIVAGSIATPEQIRQLSEEGAWGFTIGGAIFDGLLPGGSDVSGQVRWVAAFAASLNGALDPGWG